MSIIEEEQGLATITIALFLVLNVAQQQDQAPSFLTIIDKTWL